MHKEPAVMGMVFTSRYSELFYLLLLKHMGTKRL